MKDVAREAGVALGTVSRYLNGESVKKANCEAIEAAINKLGYVQNPIAKTMKTGKSMTVGVLVPVLSNMFSMRIIESVEKYLQKYGYSVIVSSSGNSESKQAKRLGMLKNKMADGIVLMPCSESSAAIAESIGDTPVVLIDRVLDENLFDSVTVSNKDTVYDRVSALIRSGYKRFGIIDGPADVYTAKQRRLGYDAALKDNGLTSVFEARGDYNVESGYNIANRLGDTELDVLFVANHEMTIGVIKAYASLKHKPKLLGFDSLEIGSPEGASFIMQPVEEIGTRAAELLLRRMSGKADGITSTVIRID